MVTISRSKADRKLNKSELSLEVAHGLLEDSITTSSSISLMMSAFSPLAYGKLHADSRIGRASQVSGLR